MKYITIKDEEGIIRPKAYLWKVDDKIKYYIDEIKKAGKDTKSTFVEVEIIETGNKATLEEMLKNVIIE